MMNPLTSPLRSLALWVLLVGATTAHADLMLYPTRVIIDGRQQSAQIELVNRGTKAETYRINLVNRRMTEDGQIIAATEAMPGEQFASDMIRYSPRQVTLEPGSSQTVRIMVRKPAGLASGEYRSHLQFDRVPDVEGQSDIESLAKPPEGEISIVLQALIGASIPVIVREGKTEASVTLDNLQLDKNKGATPQLHFVIRRAGNRSVYGNFTALFTPSQGKPVQIGRADGVAVYVPNTSRTAALPLELPAGLTLSDGVLTLNYKEPTAAGGKLIALADITVQ